MPPCQRARERESEKERGLGQTGSEQRGRLRPRPVWGPRWQQYVGQSPSSLIHPHISRGPAMTPFGTCARVHVCRMSNCA